MVYNLTNFTSANNVLTMGVAANDLVGGWLFVFVAVFVFAISFLAMINYGSRDALLAASFVTFLLNASLWASGLISMGAMTVTFVLLLVALGAKILID